jgi:hypothetical protein
MTESSNVGSPSRSGNLGGASPSGGLGNPSPSGGLGNASRGYGLAAVVTILFNTVLACVKDAYQPLSRFMGTVAGHNWTAQGVADVVLFFGLGWLFMKTGWGEKVEGRLTLLLAGAVVAAGVGLVAWYVVF